MIATSCIIIHYNRNEFFLLLEFGSPSIFEADSEELQEVAIDSMNQNEEQNSEPNDIIKYP